MVNATVTSRVSGRVINRTYTARQILDFFDEEELVLDMTKCGCQPVGETYVVDCNCDYEWEDYVLELE